MKYLAYQKSIEEIIGKNSNKKFRVMIAGAGRGGLALALARAFNKMGRDRLDRLFLIERNFNCKFALKNLVNKNQECKLLRERTKVIIMDIRKLCLERLDNQKIDLVISEMIGGFGCNELSPDITAQIIQKE